MNADMLHRAQLKRAGFVQEGDYNFIKGDFVVEMYHNTVFVNRVYNELDAFNAPRSYGIPLISSAKGFENYKYRNIPPKKVVDWLCGDLTKLEMNVENYLLSKSLEVLD
jgi:hypothetical protein